MERRQALVAKVKKKKAKANHESLCENPSGAHSDSKTVKIKGVSSSENLAIQALEDGALPLPPIWDNNT